MSYAPKTASAARVTTGELYKPSPSSTGICGLTTCIRCGSKLGRDKLEADRQVRYALRCRDRDACKTARGWRDVGRPLRLPAVPIA